LSDALPRLNKYMDVIVVLRRRFFYCLIALGLGSALGLYFSGDLIRILQMPFQEVLGPGRTLVFMAPTEAFMANMWVGIIAGALLAAPYLFLQGWWVLAPVMYRQQRKTFMFVAMFTAVTFVCGGIFGYFVVLPLAMNLLVRGFEMNSIFEAVLSVQKFCFFALKLLFAFGLAFELPVVMLILGRLGLVTAQAWWRGFRYAVVLIFLIAGILTPPDIFTQIAVAAPLCLLYATGAGLVTLFGKKSEIKQT